MNRPRSEKDNKALAKSYDRLADVARQAAAREVERLNQAVKSLTHRRGDGPKAGAGDHVRFENGSKQGIWVQTFGDVQPIPAG